MCVVSILAELAGADDLMLPKFYWVCCHARVNAQREGERERESPTKAGHGTGLSLIRRQKWGNWMKQKECGGINDIVTAKQK